MAKPSALTPDEVASFEAASADRSSSSPLSPPYDPEHEEREAMREARSPKGKRTSRNATKKVREELARKDRVRLAIVRYHLRWVARNAGRMGFDPYEVELWEL